MLAWKSIASFSNWMMSLVVATKDPKQTEKVMSSVVGTRKTQYHPGDAARRREALRKEQMKSKPADSIAWEKVTAESLNVLVQFKKLFADPKHKKAGRLKAKCTRKNCGGMIWAATSGPPKHHLRFACTNTSTDHGGTGECYIQGME
jgi:hypothetical protein